MSVYSAADAAAHEESTPDDTPATVDLLAALAGPGPALELGVGAGRVAIPLAARGIRVVGIDESPAMLAVLRASPGGEGVETVTGDFADVPVDGCFRLVYVVYDTLTALPTQRRQRECFGSVAPRLLPGGLLVVEASMPPAPPDRRTVGVDDGYGFGVKSLQKQTVVLEGTWTEPVEQRIYTQWVLLGDAGVRLLRFEMRYALPGELDEMAAGAGLRLRDRWGDWEMAPFSAAGRRHISVYEAEPAPDGRA